MTSRVCEILSLYSSMSGIFFSFFQNPWMYPDTQMPAADKREHHTVPRNLVADDVAISETIKMRLVSSERTSCVEPVGCQHVLLR
jgi:hypothetical protein